MKRKVYDAHHAAGLIPLLRSITNEIQEREEAIDRLNAHRSTARASDRSELDAALSVHKRELRLAQRELERLGCALDKDHPLRVLIPSSAPYKGRDFAWSPEDETIHTS